MRQSRSSTRLRIVAITLMLMAGRPELGPLRSQAPIVEPVCGDLIGLTMPNVSIASAASVPAGPFSATPTAKPVTVPAMCRLVATATPTSDSAIAVEVWLPLAGVWNGRLLGTDNGGFAGAIGYAAMASAVNRGYATVGTDTGHTGDQMDFLRGHPEKGIDWAYRAIHVAAEIAKVVIRSHYGRFPHHSYFVGCSTGGQQALSEAQRFPGDYDGLVAGNPGHNRTGLILGFLWSWTAMHPKDGPSVLSPAKLPMITRAAIDACDADDGLKDGLIGDPRRCSFDPAALLCKDGDGDSCLTAAEVKAVTQVYEGARHAKTGEQIFPGWARGSEQGWRAYITDPREPVRAGFFRYVIFDDPKWHWRTFDWDKDVESVRSRGAHFDATSLDYRAFQARGGKLLMYTGLADPVVPPADTMAYYDAVAKASGGLAETQRFFRFFPVPGMAHCGGGAGPNTFDALGAIETWVERGTAPTRIVASHLTAGRVDRTRPLCPYPQVARYTGKGSIDEHNNFECAAKF